MNVKRNTVGLVTFLSPDAALIGENMPLLDEAITGCLAKGEIRLILDLTHVPYIDSEALEKLLEYGNQFRKKGGSIKISNPNPLCNEILKITGMSQYFDISFDLKEAARGFASL
jgi:anti-anti-sigma factor